MSERRIFWFQDNRSCVDLKEVVSVRPLVVGVKVYLRFGRSIEILDLGDDVKKFYSAFRKATNQEGGKG